jgi:hypothetical protein
VDESLGSRGTALRRCFAADPIAACRAAKLNVRLDGAIVAENWDALLGLVNFMPIDRIEYGVLASRQEVWTGTSSAGAPISGGTCSNLTNGVSGIARTGNSSATNYTWTNSYNQFCDRTNVRLYCFEQ